MRKVSLLLAALISDHAIAYPQTIRHGYKDCISCHISNDGGDTLNDYGRAMSEAFMSTWSNEGAARELLGQAELEHFDFGLDYRSMSITRDGKRDSFPMYAAGQLAYRYYGLTAFWSYGNYGRDRKPESRGYWVGYHGNSPHNFDFKLGYFLPCIGSGLNNHDLIVKKAFGLGRNQERFSAQFGYRGPWVTVKIIRAVSDFSVAGKNEDNTLSPDFNEPPAHYLEARLRLKGFDAGFHMRHVSGQTDLIGTSLRAGIGRVYMLGEYSSNPIQKLDGSFVRPGIYIFPGFDFFYEYQFQRSAIFTESNAVGFSWMLRPRLELEGSLTKSQGSETIITSTKLWL